ncbi:precorrin-3B C(17)-methyltransferase [Myxosarcina sp. GI1]|uniref:precorrin-3B C(17)-methyltransferase n=1 Tax=Myxosarcina sp. GI1 TaxID=1541065 RepID=UPI0006911D05|nr:precorrin-3B C(17)-methyltransferase [Myxosarcina sp. GI1]
MLNSSFEPFQPLAAIATNQTAARILQPLCQTTEATLWLPESVEKTQNAQYYHSSLKKHLTSIWTSHKAIVFCLAAGAVVRLIAPLLADKQNDPAIVVIDSLGRYVISLCGGHQGGADLLTQLIADTIGAVPVVTGAASSCKLPAIDTLGVPYGWRKGEGDWTGVMAAAARGETVQVIQEVGNTLWQEHLPEQHSFSFDFSEIKPQARIWISLTQRKFAPKSDFPKVQWHPRVLWVGIGCERGTSRQLIETAINTTCQKYHLAKDAIAGIASIDIKSDETGILELCGNLSLPFKTFTAEQLRQVTVPTPSNVVANEVGTPSVAEAAAILAANNQELLVTKQIFKGDNEPGAVTVAIAQAELEYTGRTGKLFLVGIGPGSLDQITPAAKTAITSADAIIGYSLYTELIEPLQRVGQIIESLPITQEKQRARRAIELAQWGLTVAVISSGDCGIYGMAGLVLEALQADNWDGKTPQVQIFPGISALQAAASRAGAPLMHDFCAISLSDLLTPWEVITKRLQAAAQGDFIVAIYNPRSQKRTQQIITAREIFLQHRPSNTPVAIVREAYRDNEQVTLTTLEKMLEAPIDMLTTVIIGNNNTRNYANWMITPRGYSVNV